MNDELANQLHIELPSAAGPRRIELRIAPVLRVSGLLFDDTLPYKETRSWAWVPLLVFEMIGRIDGRRPSNEEVDRLSTDKTFVVPLLSHVRNLLDAMRERGKVYALCPGCRTWEPEITFTAYGLLVADPIPSSFQGPYLAPITLASPTLLGDRRDIALLRAAQIRVELPSRFLDLAAPIAGGVLGLVVHQEGEDGDDDDNDGNDSDSSGDGDDGGDDTPYEPTRRGPGYRALVRLSHALQPPVSVEQLEALPLIDLLFLDLVHYLTVQARIAADTPGRLTCPTCKTIFVPIAARPGERAP